MAAGLPQGHQGFSSLGVLASAPIQKWSLFPLEPGWPGLALTPTMRQSDTRPVPGVVLNSTSLVEAS